MVAALLSLLLSSAPAAAAAPDVTACSEGDGEACLRVARGHTGASQPVDLMKARAAYQQACRVGASEGCAGAEGIARYLGRHVELHFLPSDGRLWALYGPMSVAEGREPQAPGKDVALAMQKRLVIAESCYRNAFQSNPRLAGTLDVSLVVEGGRVVEQILHQASLPSEDAARCIVEELSQVRLPASFPKGELFLRLQAEPAPDPERNAPVVQDHLADGAQSTVGAPRIQDVGEADAERLGVALTVSARRGLQGERCILDAVKAGDWGPTTLLVQGQLTPPGRLESVTVRAVEGETPASAACLQAALEGLAVGATGVPHAVPAQLTIGYAPAWTATVVPR